MEETGTKVAAAYLSGSVPEGEKCTLLRNLFSYCSYCSRYIGTGPTLFGFRADKGVRCFRCGWVYCSEHVTSRSIEKDDETETEPSQEAPMCHCCLDREKWLSRPVEIRNKITLIDSVIVVGTGMGGLSAALALKNRGVSSVTVLEKESKLRTSGGSIIIQVNAMRALMDIDPEVMARVFDTAGPLDGFGAFKSIDGKVLLASNLSTRKESRWGNPEGRSIVRGYLTQILYDRCIQVGVKVHFGVKVTSTKEESELVIVTAAGSDDAGAQARSFSAELVVAADGIWSKVRQQVFPDGPKPSYAGYQMIVSVAPKQDFDQMSLDCWGESWGTGDRVGHFRCGQGGTAIYFARNCKEDLDGSKNQSELKKVLVDSVKERGYDENLVRLVSAADVNKMYLYKIRHLPPLEHHISATSGRIILLGDAANGMPPNLGQGGGMALESASILSQMLLSSDTLEEALNKYEQRRMVRCCLIADQSKKNGDIFQAGNFVTVSMRNALFAYVGKESNKQDVNDLELQDPFAYLFSYRLVSWPHNKEGSF